MSKSQWGQFLIYQYSKLTLVGSCSSFLRCRSLKVVINLSSISFLLALVAECTLSIILHTCDHGIIDAMGLDDADMLTAMMTDGDNQL